MKHTEKRFLFQKLLSDLTDDQIAKIKEGSIKLEAPGISISKEIKKRKDQIPVIITEKKWVISPFIYSKKGHIYLIPEPDQVLIYFNCAQSSFRYLHKKKEQLLHNLNLSNPNITNLSENMINEIYNFFGATSGFVIFLFMAMEAFLNRLIPDDYRYQRNLKTEFFNRNKILRHISFEEKMTVIIKEIRKKDFTKNYPKKHQIITRLGNFRDDIIHTKPEVGINKYKAICILALNFKYEDSMHAVRDFMNYYSPGYIKECDCGNDF